MDTVRKIFLLIFILSTLGVLMLFLFPPRLMTPSPSVTQSPEAAPTASIGSPTTAEPSSENTNNMNFTALVGSVVTRLLH